jgi:hypothetical protein
LRVQLLFNAGILSSITVALPGAQGATVIGIHGMGVSTPNAAVVAALTAGFAIEEHMANGGIFTIGILSIIFAAGILLVSTLFFGKTIKDAGAAPKEQVIIAPIHT